jgi:hypothetical protein
VRLAPNVGRNSEAYCAGLLDCLRVRVFDMVAADRLVAAGMHLHFPGFARMTKAGGTFALVAET